MKDLCHGQKWSENESQIGRFGKYKTVMWIKSQVGQCNLRTASGQKPTNCLKACDKRGYYGGYKRQDDHQEK